MTACPNCDALLAVIAELRAGWDERLDAFEQALLTVADTVDMLVEYIDPEGFAATEALVTDVAVTGDRL